MHRDAGLARAGWGKRKEAQSGGVPALRTTSPREARDKLSKGVLAVEMSQLAHDLRKPRRATQSLFLPRLQAPQDLASIRPPRSQTPGFPGSQIGGPRRQTAGTANGKTQSVNFVFARHSQPVCVSFSGVPPSVSGAPFWQHTDGVYLSPSCVWHRYFFWTLCTYFSLCSHTANLLVPQPRAEAMKRV